MRDCDAIIIGSGVIGCAIAFELSRLGYRTVNVDRLSAAGAGPTGNSCAIVRAHYSTHEGVAMAHEAFSYWRNWRDYLELGRSDRSARYLDVGTLWLLSEDGNHERTLQLYDQLGVRYERWDVDELKRRYPLFDTHAFWPPTRPDEPGFAAARSKQLVGAVFTPDSGYVDDPKLAAEDLQRAAERHNARFLFQSTVAAITTRDGQVNGVKLADGQALHSRVVVNVAGPHSALINSLAGVTDDMNVGTRALRHEVHYVPAPAGFTQGNGGCHVSDADSGIYFRPEAGGTLLVGSEDPACDPKHWIDDLDDYDREVSVSQWKAQVYRCARRIPTLEIPASPRGIVDLYDCSEDWIPIYDRTNLGGYYMAVGTSGNQFKNAPVVGRLMANLIDACENGHDHDRDPIRLKTLWNDHELNTGFYSRRRELNPDSSRSVMG